ncbi:MAG: translation initiation factor IF-2 [Pseudomonadota bacterium]|jgi:translation initiation factor IF-2|nr:translation initiation factor IF-2 [Syntrophobacterales bacterium]MDI9555135.1 translation initiation factor IF-2 [Pseudomonadota bacterium]HPV54416.1 translation initiation factor IF-2 [Syntrophales bacterium]HPX01393.1 translation initiation factor IF-2 [Syntrophales bacterium]HQC23650.1 translation initiation factor IF-2 [Syntrophales bacterium]
MSKVRVYELAKEFGIENKEFIARLKTLGIAVKSHSSTLEDSEVERVRREFAAKGEMEVVEKRVKSTVIRRRAVRLPVGEAPEAEEAAAPAPEAPVEPAEPAGKEEGAAKPEKEEKDGIPEMPGKASLPEKTAETGIEEPQSAAAPLVSEKAPAKPELPPRKEPDLSRQAQIIRRPEPAGAKPASRPPAAITPQTQIRKPAGPARSAGAEARGAAAEADKKGKKAVEVVMDSVAAKKKSMIKQGIDKKDKRVRLREIEEEESPRWKGERKAAVKMRKTEITTPKAIKRRIRISEAIRVGELAKQMSVRASDVINKLLGLGMMVTINQSIDVDAATLIAAEFGYQVEAVTAEYDELLQRVETEPRNLRPRAPVVTVMGHVDHGKTSLLDAIRQTNVIEGEAGGITQAIGAYHVHVKDRDIVFLDTPGHEAFTAMRARGAKVTDIVVLVVAADDGVMEQTVEAINHSRSAGVPIIVAVNKIDRPNATPDRIKQELAQHNLMSEEWGGDALFAHISAKKKIGIENLLELILLQADVLELKADPDRPARGIVIEAKLDKGRGPVATVLIQEGTLREGDAFSARTEYGRVRAMIDDQGRRVKAAGPSMPVEVIGFSSVPQAGSEFIGVEDEKKARNISEYWIRKEREKELAASSKITLEQLYQRIKEGAKELNVILKADVQGSLEALTEALHKLSTDEIKLKLIHSSTGAITETDVMLASASDAIILGFRVRPDARVVEIAGKEGVEIKLYDIIYNAINDVRAAMEGLLEPEFREVVQGRAEVRETFRIVKVGTVAGCYVTDGKIPRSAGVRLVRDGVVVYDGKIASLKRFKDDAKEVTAGMECGLGIEGYNDIRTGDVIEAYITEQIERRL